MPHTQLFFCYFSVRMLYIQILEHKSMKYIVVYYGYHFIVIACVRFTFCLNC